MLELPQGTTEIFEVFPRLSTFFIAPTASEIILGQLCQSENKFLHKLIDMTSDHNLIPKQKTSILSS